MSLKSIELQIAIPKTFDAGKLTEQKNQQSVLNHQQAAAQTEELVHKQRKSVMDSAHSEKTNGKDQTADSGSPSGGGRKDPEDEKEEFYASHPYKGGFVDYTG
ncbi:hypothetical protein NCCP2716_03220 [Sporosarcina sp. NCCP-2716]|uniref:hypothetical protein n=1 Tax=Sporosarcina sp. NCCP-2716 TaxID=2943679 RepID=UPI00203D92CC|nr:hypothetical protein [Sporosarcina sp. NCCP-2716]GKV67824.1 hypothetical protein NCCP2716_03220 [Sporosarcina sp. NCCP-2716]